MMTEALMHTVTVTGATTTEHTTNDTNQTLLKIYVRHEKETMTVSTEDDNQSPTSTSADLFSLPVVAPAEVEDEDEIEEKSLEKSKENDENEEKKVDAFISTTEEIERSEPKPDTNIDTSQEEAFNFAAFRDQLEQRSKSTSKSEPDAHTNTNSSASKEVTSNFATFRDQLEQKAKSTASKSTSGGAVAVAVVDLDDYYTKQRNEKQNDKKKQMEAANILRSYHAGVGPETLSSSASAAKNKEVEISKPEQEPESQTETETEEAFNFSAFRDQLERKAKTGAVVSLDDHYNKQRNEKQNDKKKQIEAANILRSYHSGGGPESTTAAKKMDVDADSNSIDITSPSDDGGGETGTGSEPVPVPLQSPEVYSVRDISNIPKYKHLLTPPDREYMKWGIFKCFGSMCVN